MIIGCKLQFILMIRVCKQSIYRGLFLNVKEGVWLGRKLKGFVLLKGGSTALTLTFIYYRPIAAEGHPF